MSGRRRFLGRLLALSSLVFSGAAEARRKQRARPQGASRRSSGSRRNTANRPPPLDSLTGQSVVERPPSGTSATKLPACRAPQLASDWQHWRVRLAIAGPLTEPCQLWLPAPDPGRSLSQRISRLAWRGAIDKAAQLSAADGWWEAHWFELKAGDTPAFECGWDLAIAPRRLDVAQRRALPERNDLLQKCLEASALIPVDDRTRQVAQAIRQLLQDPLAIAYRLYQWLHDVFVSQRQSQRLDADAVRSLIVAGQGAADSALLTAVWVSLCRSLGIPARLVWGFRLASEAWRSEFATGADKPPYDEVRGECYLPGYGWIAVNPGEAIAAKAAGVDGERVNLISKSGFGLWDSLWFASHASESLTAPSLASAEPAFLPRALLLAADGSDLSTSLRWQVEALPSS